MSKVKKTGKLHYEILYIVPNKYTEDEATKIAQGVEKEITDKKGDITYREEWGKRRFAYPINHFNHGYYFLMEFDLNGSDLVDLDRYLRMSNEVLRHQIVKKRKRTAEEIAKEKELSEKVADDKEKESSAVEDKKIKKEKVDKKVVEKEDKKKLELKDLDQKLDKILETDDLLK